LYAVIGDILQPTHLLLILVVALLVLGPKRLPEVGRSLGRGLRDFRHALSSEDSQDETVTPMVPPTAESAPEPVQEPVERVG
jgi:sec-independent protein translocase protein TatA